MEIDKRDDVQRSCDVIVPTDTTVDQGSADDSMADKEGASDTQDNMVRESGDGEDETQKLPEKKPPAQKREVGDGMEEELGEGAPSDRDTGAPAGAFTREAGNFQENVIPSEESRSIPGADDERPSVIPAVSEDHDSGRNSQTETTDVEKLEEVRKSSGDERLVEGREVEKQTTVRDNKVSSAGANLGSRDEAKQPPSEEVNSDDPVQDSLVEEVDRRQVKTSYNRSAPRQNRLPAFRSAHAHVQCLQAPRAFRDSEHAKHVPRFPPGLIRLATVTMAPKTPDFLLVDMLPPLEVTLKPKERLPRGKSMPGVPSLYYEEPRRPRKVITWDEATNSRPPLRVDMEGPTPCSYSPRNKPLYETNAPAWTIGTRCSLDREGGARTSWVKTWFQTPHVWQSKVDFSSDGMWPSPNDYKKSSLLGPKQRTMTEYPAFTMGRKGEFSYVKPGADKEPSPVEYDLKSCDRALYRSMPSYTHQFRREGTILWSPGENTPGPGAYSPSSCSHRHSPSFSIKGIRREKSHVLGPYSTF